MTKKAVFEGLVIDERDQPAEVVYVGDEPCYVVDDSGFRRHIPSEHVDMQVLQAMLEMIEGHEDLLTAQTAKMLGSEDPFSVAMIGKQLENIDKQMETLLETGIPEELRAYLGMMGFRVRIDMHGDVIAVDQPGRIIDDDE